MKRIISYLLAFVLILLPCLHIQAQKNEMQNEEAANETVMETDAFASWQTESLEINETEALGQVDVLIMSAMILERNVEFTITLTDQEEKSVILPSDTEANSQTVQRGASFENLAAGDYVLTVSAPGFADYTQEIKVEDQAYFVKLMTGFVNGYDYENGPHPGVILIGDVNSDGAVNDDDKAQLIDAVDSGVWNDITDLNGDGETNLIDLETFTAGYQVESAESTINCGIPAKAAKVNVDSSTVVAEGDLNALMTHEGGAVKLMPAAGGEISPENPVSLEFDLSESQKYLMDGMTINTETDNAISSMEANIVYEDEEGNEQTIIVPFEESVQFLLDNEEITAAQDGSGAVIIDFGTQIAVKKVTLLLKGMKKDATLAEISKVEFLNGMENRIPEPSLDIPQNLSVQAGNKTFTLTWDPCVNVTGYEALVRYEEEEELVYAKGNSLTFTSFKGDKLVNNTPYTVEVRSVNGTWRSAYSAPSDVVMKADKKPDAPDNLKLTGKYKAIDATWKKMEDTDSYNLYYRESGTEEYTKIEGITANSYTLANLKDKTGYQVYVTGVNEIGESNPSLIGYADTTNPEPAQMPKYKLINRASDNQVSEHIINASYVNGSMVDSALDAEGKTAWGTVDNNPYSHFLLNSWDSGGYNPLGVNGVTYEFDQPYKLQTIALQEVSVQSPGYGYVRVKYWDADGNVTEINRMGIQRKVDAENRVYYMINLPQAVTAKKIQFGVSRSVASGTITFSEVYFYHYDSLEDDIMALYEDDLHTVLRSDVTQATIDDLRDRINTKDPECGEYHPEQEKLERELKTAEDILNSKLSSSVRIHNGITTGEINRGFSGLNAWQPLGVTVAAGEEITVYVGHNTKKTGENTNLQLVATQYHAESASVSSTVATLKVGRNDITIPTLSTIDAEAGGALYIQYTGNNANDQYAVRVSGGVSVPILDLYQITDQNERLNRAETYLTELEAYVNQIESVHQEQHKNSKLTSVNKYEYQAANCILGASDIMLDQMLLSLPAQQILAGCGGNAQTLVNSMDAIENMMYLFYQHKGLNKAAADVIDQIPSRHLNIRYQRMFAGAFMYAAGNHIGIEWNETKGMVGGSSVQADENGKYLSGHYFGWGIAHEIGHNINQGSYAFAEVTNNYFAVLAQAQDNNSSVRFIYDNVYKKVTSGTKGVASNVFTQLGMYWQLHLAYDNGYNFKTYENYEEQLQSLFFARVDTYARTPSKAPAPNGTALALTGDRDQNLMRLSCAAAEKNILEFFERWGMTPDEDTTLYASQFEKETRAIYYVNDDSRVYRLEHAAEGSSLGVNGDVEAVGGDTSATVNANQANRVDINLTSTNPDTLGYEIVRCTTSGGEVEKEVVGFTTDSVFTDYVTTMNNRVVTYEITVIDNYLNRSAIKTLSPIKIEHKGNIDKTNWTVQTADLTATSQTTGDDQDYDDTCAPKPEEPIKNAVDQNVDTVYTATAGENAEIILEFNREYTITGFDYQVNEGNPIQDYSIFILDVEGNWLEAASGTFGESKTVYFEKNGNVAAYSTSAVKLAIKNQSGKEIAISELDALGITGDNIDFGTGDVPAVGKLLSDFTYDAQGNFIPAGSIVFTGSYKGNPAYNVVVLYDQDGEIVSNNDQAEQIILADVPSTGNIQDVNDGKWIYWIKPDGLDLTKLQRVRAELYRVDNALTNEGQRLVSDSLFVEIPSSLPDITLTQSGQ